jgi:hypothetical protein
LTNLKKNDLIRYNGERDNASYGKIHGFTVGQHYLVMGRDHSYPGETLLTVKNDRGNEVGIYARRFTKIADTFPIHRSRQEAAVAEGFAKVSNAEFTAPYGRTVAPGTNQQQVAKKVQLLFTEVSTKDVHEALGRILIDKFGHMALKVVDLDKTTEGFKLTLVNA